MRLRLTLIAASGAALLSVSWPAAAAAPTDTVVLDKMNLGPQAARLRHGDTIVWVNRDFLRHTATADHSFDVDLPAGAKATTVIKRSGAIPFTCRFHPGMRGVLQVK